MALLLVCGRILFSSGSKVLQKQLTMKGLSPLLIVAATFAFLSAILAPFLTQLSWSGLSLMFWGSIALAALLDTPGNLFLVKSVQHADLSIIGPLNAYKPIVALLLGVVVLGEVPGWQGLMGMGVVFSGSLFLAPGGEKAGSAALRALLRDRGVQFRVLSLLMTAAASIFLKVAIQESSSMQTFMLWALFSTSLAVGGYLALATTEAAQAVSQLRGSMLRMAGIALSILCMQLLTLKLFEMMYVAYALALFQLSAVVNVGFGRAFFQEENIVQRALASIVMVIGAALLVTS